MPIISDTILHDDALLHVAQIDYRKPCIEERRRPTRRGLNWFWEVIFKDSNGDGIVDALIILAKHRVAPHAGEPVPNLVGPVVHRQPCRGKVWPPMLVLSRHGRHEDRMLTRIRRVPASGPLHRIFIVLQHTQVSTSFDPPDIPLESGGLLKDLF